MVLNCPSWPSRAWFQFRCQSLDVFTRAIVESDADGNNKLCIERISFDFMSSVNWTGFAHLGAWLGSVFVPATLGCGERSPGRPSSSPSVSNTNCTAQPENVPSRFAKSTTKRYPFVSPEEGCIVRASCCSAFARGESAFAHRNPETISGIAMAAGAGGV